MKKRILAIVMIMALVFCLTACGNAETEPAGEGEISISDETSHSEQNSESEPSSDDSSEESGSSEESTSSSEPEESSVPLSSLADHAKVIFRGTTIGLGDTFKDLSDKIGAQTRPSDRSQPCIPGAGEIIRYYYPGLIIETSEADIICGISISDEYDAGNEAVTAGGFKLGGSGIAAKETLGEPQYDIPGMYSYSEGTLMMSVVANDSDEVILISIEDNSYLIEE